MCTNENQFKRIMPFSENLKKRKDKQIFEPCQSTKKLSNIKVTVISIVVGALGAFPKFLV